MSGVTAAPARLLVVAPSALGRAIVDALAAPGLAVSVVVRNEPGSDLRDPYRLACLAEKAAGVAEAVLLVVPRRRSPARVAPSAVIQGLTVGIVQASSLAELAPWLNAVGGRCDTPPVWATMAMGQDFYLALGGGLAEDMRRGAAGSNLNVEDWRADRLSRAELCASLARGPRLAVYVGHGRASGWSGYQALRWRHVAAAPLVGPAGLIVGFTCDTLKYDRGTSPFGCRWVREGRAAAYLGATNAVISEAGARLVEAFGGLLAERRFGTIGALLSALNRRLAEDRALADARHAFRAFRLIGHPLLPIDG